MNKNQIRAVASRVAICWAIVFMLMTLTLGLYSCKGNGGEQEKQSQAHKELLGELDDSINAMSPKMIEMARAGMNQAMDSLSYYEFGLRLGNIYGMLQSDSCPLLAKRTLKFALAQKKNSRINELISQSYGNLGSYYYTAKMNADSALHYDMLAYQFMMKVGNSPDVCDVCANIADIYTQNNDMAQGAKWYRRGLFLVDSLNLPKSINTSIYLGLAQVYTYLRDYDSALQYYTMADKHIEDLKPNMRIYLLNNYGNFYFFKQDYGKALLQFQRASRLLRDYGMENSQDMMICRLNMADVFQNLNMTDSARTYLDGLEPYFKNQGLDMAVYYVNTIKIALALKSNRVEKVKEIVDGEKSRFVDYSSMSDIRAKYLLQYYVKTGDFKRAYENLSFSTRRNDSVENSKSHVRTAEIMMRFQQDTLALHNKINMDEKSKEVKEAYIMLGIALTLIIITALIATIVVINLRRRHLQMKYDMLKLHATNVRNRISPHFIFNVLNHEIGDRSRSDSDPTQLANLTMLIRNALSISDKTFVSLKEELGFVSKYIDIEKQILGSNFLFTCQVQPGINMETTKLPSMFIQILVENAIKHGLKMKEGHKQLSVNITYNDNRFTDITVSDNGAGFDATRMSPDGTGTGLNVIRQTISVFNAHNKIKMRFSISNSEENGQITGCVAHLQIPDNIQ